MTDYRGLGFDPVPGSAEAVAAVSARCSFDVVVPRVPDGWTGAAADGLATRLAAVVSELAEVRRAMRGAAEVLDSWATTLLDNQRRAEELDRRAVRLRRDLAEAVDEVDQAGALAGLAPAHAEAHAAVARHDDLVGRLDEVLGEARLLARDHHAEAGRVAARLRSEEASALSDTLTGLSAATAELASVLLGAPVTAAPRGAAAAFAAGLG
ncbi:hypothetical protein [Saccharothrix australiensis]|uniref:Uncharacterized protein n=1 Tax=Saccharothrix australiensis TaxID=2072 RepID=A0A495W5U4_9PSEU|nr:hypothetical protein [Saccharothrix australiensis]RKT56437.1 hypothetical protein C8E97_5136 [Saccharothrix australiensis]